MCDPAHVGGLTRQRATLLPRYSAGQALLATSLGPRWGFVGGRTQCYNLTDPLEIQRRPLRSSGINTELPREDRKRCCSRTLMRWRIIGAKAAALRGAGAKKVGLAMLAQRHQRRSPHPNHPRYLVVRPSARGGFDPPTSDAAPPLQRRPGSPSGIGCVGQLPPRPCGIVGQRQLCCGRFNQRLLRRYRPQSAMRLCFWCACRFNRDGPDCS